jgi:tetratricopeptide (TPR) repeat protein
MTVPDAAGPPPAADCDDVLDVVARGHQASLDNQFVEAENYFRKAIAVDGGLPMAHNNLGWALYKQNRFGDAIQSYRDALKLNPDLALARINLATLFWTLGRIDEARALWLVLIDLHGQDQGFLNSVVSAALSAGDLRTAGGAAAQLAKLRLSSAAPGTDNVLPLPKITNDKLRHDIAQLQYLRSQGFDAIDLDDILDRYQRVLEKSRHRGLGVSFSMDAETRDLIGHVYGRIVNWYEAGRQVRALAARDAEAVERAYTDRPPGLVVIDNFLAPEALESLRQFCLQSTVWFGNRYAHGRLGAFFREGFCCPLLIQIAEEIQAAFPRMIGQPHRLQQIWGFKYDRAQPATNAHADFAAVNVNFWITPDEANLDPKTGGMIVYDLEAPLDWGFDTYNEQGARIAALLKEKQSTATHVAYKANRAIIFNSDLFHATASVNFRDGYENRRVNVTMLFGKRENDMQR